MYLFTFSEHVNREVLTYIQFCIEIAEFVDLLYGSAPAFFEVTLHTGRGVLFPSHRTLSEQHRIHRFQWSSLQHHTGAGFDHSTGNRPAVVVKAVGHTHLFPIIPFIACSVRF